MTTRIYRCKVCGHSSVYAAGKTLHCHKCDGEMTSFGVGDTVRNALNGRLYRLREIRKTVAIVQIRSHARALRIENIASPRS